MDSEKVYENRTLSILLITLSVILFIGGILNIQFFSTQYGLGAGALLSSKATNTTITPILRYAASQTSLLYQAILESYLITILGFVLFSMSFVLWLHKQNGYEKYLRVYVPLCIFLIIIYLALLIIMYSTFDFSFYSLTLYIIYFSLFTSIVIDLYIGYKVYGIGLRKRFGGITITPSTPYTNMINLKEKLFSAFSGNVGIVDKHFNSQALGNLYRLISDNRNIKRITVISSNEMLDSSFNREYKDLKNELEGYGTILEVKLMNNNDSIQQHERFIFDDDIAYKIPPMNIINKKSEHIVKIGRRDAVKRFEELILNSTKIE